MSIDGLRTIITGAGSGIGQATAVLFLEGGARVAGFDVTIGGIPAGAHRFDCDVSDDAGVRTAVEAAAELLGGIDIVVNNAGIGAAGDVTANDDDEWRRLFDVNVMLSLIHI